MPSDQGVQPEDVVLARSFLLGDAGPSTLCDKSVLPLLPDDAESFQPLHETRPEFEVPGLLQAFHDDFEIITSSA